MATKQPVHQFYAWCGILAMKAHRPEVHYMTPDEVQRADQLIADFTRKWRLKSWYV